MAIVTIRFNKNAESTLAYVFKGRESTDPVDSANCSPTKDGSTTDFASVRDLHNIRNGNEAIHVVQSWGPDESKTISPRTVNEMGMELANRYFPGHQFVVVTHTDTGKFHNHIIVNPIGIEQGKRIPDKKIHLKKLREISDEICVARGLSVINPDQRLRRERMPEAVRQIERRKGSSYVMDMRQKADLARAYSTTYDQYATILQGLGVAVRVEKQNISYLYNGHTRATRGDKLGKSYDKTALEASFRANDDRFAAKAELWARLRPGDSTSVLAAINDRGKKDYAAFTPVSRGSEWAQVPTSATLKSSPFPIDAIYRASRASIPAYLNQNRVELATNDRGQTILKKRPYVVIEEQRWTNTRNKTQGSLIDIVASHRNLTLLQSVAHITGQSHLTEFETHFGKVERKSQSFYLPRPDGEDWKRSVETAAQFIKSFGGNPKVASKLIGSGRARVTDHGRIRFETDGEQKSYLELAQDDFGDWKKSSKKNVTKPLHSAKGTGSSLLLFSTPQSYLKTTGPQAFVNRNRRHNVLVLFEANTEAIDDHLKQHPHIKKIEFSPFTPQKPSHAELDFFGILKARYGSSGFEVGMAAPDRSLSRGGHDMDL